MANASHHLDLVISHNVSKAGNFSEAKRLAARSVELSKKAKDHHARHKRHSKLARELQLNLATHQSKLKKLNKEKRVALDASKVHRSVENAHLQLCGFCAQRAHAPTVSQQE